MSDPNEPTPTRDPAVDAFLDAIAVVCRGYGMSIEHEDGQGAFQVTNFNERALAWLRDAVDEREPKT